MENNQKEIDDLKIRITRLEERVSLLDDAKHVLTSDEIRLAEAYGRGQLREESE